MDNQNVQKAMPLTFNSTLFLNLCHLQGYGIGTCCGKILMMNVNKDSVPVELNITNPPSAPNFMASPHGISTWKDEKTG